MIEKLFLLFLAFLSSVQSNTVLLSDGSSVPSCVARGISLCRFSISTDNQIVHITGRVELGPNAVPVASVNYFMRSECGNFVLNAQESSYYHWDLLSMVGYTLQFNLSLVQPFYPFSTSEWLQVAFTGTDPLKSVQVNLEDPKGAIEQISGSCSNGEVQTTTVSTAAGAAATTTTTTTAETTTVLTSSSSTSSLTTSITTTMTTSTPNPPATTTPAVTTTPPATTVLSATTTRYEAASSTTTRPPTQQTATTFVVASTLNPQTEEASASGGSAGLSTGAIVGIVFAILATGVLVLIAIWISHRRKVRVVDDSLPFQELDEFTRDDIGAVTRASGRSMEKIQLQSQIFL